MGALERSGARTACGGVGKGSRVGILMTNRPEFLAAVFGTALAGGVAVPLSTFSTPPELAYLLRTSGVSILLFEASVLAKDFVEILTELEPEIAHATPGQLLSLEFPFLRRLAVVGDVAGGGAIESWSEFLAQGRSLPPRARGRHCRGGAAERRRHALLLLRLE